MNIRLLTTPDCPGTEPAHILLKKVLRHEGLDAEYQHITVETEEQAQELRFIGSPTIQIDGYDIEIARRADKPGLGCRTYTVNGEQHCQVPEALLRQAIQRAAAPNEKLLFLCTGNSCRSQMGEGWARVFHGDRYDVYSAGVETHGLNPNAVKVMAEAGVDISNHQSQHISEFIDIGLDWVVTVCGHAHESCPMFPGKVKVIHVGFDDPPKLAKAAATEEDALDCYRRVRDQIRDFAIELPQRLKETQI